MKSQIALGQENSAPLTGSLARDSERHLLVIVVGGGGGERGVGAHVEPVGDELVDSAWSRAKACDHILLIIPGHAE